MFWYVAEVPGFDPSNERKRRLRPRRQLPGQEKTSRRKEELGEHSSVADSRLSAGSEGRATLGTAARAHKGRVQPKVKDEAEVTSVAVLTTATAC